MDLGHTLLLRLTRLACNLRWAWEPSAAQLFSSLAPDTWRSTLNPAAVVRELEHGDLENLLAYGPEIEDASAELERYLDLASVSPFSRMPRVAYVSAEFAVADCLPLYAGGLGVLAGDFLKAASDLGLPLVGVGLLYRFGYFRQMLDDSGYQRERYEGIEPESLPIQRVLLGDQLPLRVGIPFPGRTVYTQVWRADVGRVPLYLLDTNVPENAADDRWITAHLYGGDEDTRIRQELVLGIGAARVLRALAVAGLEPSASRWHLNEGHSALLVLELARERMARGVSFESALIDVAQRLVFTTHTPVPAGHDAFSAELIESYLAGYLDELGVDRSDVIGLGQADPTRDGERFSMTMLALRGASLRNGVSRLHGLVSRQMWSGVGNGTRDQPPLVEMEAVTNGVHGPTWAGPEMAALFDASMGAAWRRAARSSPTWAPLEQVSAEALWQARSAQRGRLLARAGVPGDPERTLVIGFARRFATYKRAGLLLEDLDRLARLLGDDCRAVAVVFSGKAHPRDEPGKTLVQRIVEASRDARLDGRLVFLPDYDVGLARLLVQGADVWLNTPRRPMEASGTSGMKATLNGALHVSELDGWWDEAYRPELGWALGQTMPVELTESERDLAEASELLGLLEDQVVPLFFSRDAQGVPIDWLTRVRHSIQTLAPWFSAERMVTEYALRLYAHPGIEQATRPGSQALSSRFA